MKHVQHKIQACLDGELTEAEAVSVRRHCESCRECGRAWRDMSAVWEALLKADAPPLPLPLWPALERELVREQAVRPRPWPRLTYAGGALAATAAGLLLGLWMGSPRQGSLPDTTWPTLIEEGALFVEGTGWTLDRLYLSSEVEEGDDQS